MCMEVPAYVCVHVCACTHEFVPGCAPICLRGDVHVHMCEHALRVHPSVKSACVHMLVIVTMAYLCVSMCVRMCFFCVPVLVHVSA